MVDQDGLENRFTRKGNVGSNPTLTAIRRAGPEPPAWSGVLRGAVPEIRSRCVLLSLLICALCAGNAAGSEPSKGAEIRIARATGPIVIDGDLDDAGWEGAARVDTWYETNPGDNLPRRG